MGLVGKIFSGLRASAPITAVPVLVQKPLLRVSGQELIGTICRAAAYDKKILVGSYIAQFSSPFISFAQLRALGVGQEFQTSSQRSMYYSLEQVESLGKALNCTRIYKESDFTYFPRLVNMLGRHARSKKAHDIQTAEKNIYMKHLAKEIVFNGAVLPSKACYISGISIEQLGIRCGAIRGGSVLCVVSHEDFMKYAVIQGFGQGLMGVFNPNGGSEKDQDSFGVESMANRNRIIMVPDNVAAETITHEILHDIFSNIEENNSRPAPQTQWDFFSLVLEKVQACLASPDTLRPYLDFFEEISRRCSVPIELKKFAANREPYAWSFVDEVFAYSGTFAVGYPSRVAGQPPENIQAWISDRFLVPGFNAQQAVLSI